MGSKFGTLIAHNHKSWEYISEEKSAKYDWDGSGFGWWDGKPLEIKKSDGEVMIQIDRTLLHLSIHKPYKCWWKLIRPSNAIKGVTYITNSELFGDNYK